MPVPSSDVVRKRLTDLGAEVHGVQVHSSHSIVVYDASYEEHSGPIPNIPALFTMLCVSGGGRIVQRTHLQDFDSVIEPGDIGIAAPSAGGTGSWPEIRVIGLGIEISTLLESFGEKWPDRLRSDVISKPFKDPLVETTLMQIGYTKPEQPSDSVLKYAAQMIVHRLLDDPFEENSDESIEDGVRPLSSDTVGAIETFISSNIDRPIQVEEVAQISGVSRFHFSRRFKVTMGITPYQFILQKKLDSAAESLADDERQSVIDVAQSVGFDNPAQFAKAFRRRFGLTPRFWRLQRH